MKKKKINPTTKPTTTHNNNTHKLITHTNTTPEQEYVNNSKTRMCVELFLCHVRTLEILDADINEPFSTTYSDV